ncbi:MAG: hypothetical protein R3322_00250 [Kiloniellales bacterium]|nr:hypothetical protein [Kiloniellales bacterium]
MRNLLEHLIREAGAEGVVGVQLIFKDGTAMAGGLKQGPVDNTFCLGTVTEATTQTPGDFRAGDQVLVEQLFEASSVDRVMRMLAASPIVRPGAS